MADFVFNYSELTKKYESQLDGAYKKNKGIFYTDISLASLMIDELKMTKDTLILDPCCGTGIFLLAALCKGYRNVYGADEDEIAINAFRNNISDAVIISTDTIFSEGESTLEKLKLETKVDLVIGNPPYAPFPAITRKSKFQKFVASSGNNLFVAALLRSFELVKKGGIVSYIIPKNFLHVSSYSPLRVYILKSKKILSIVDLGAYFKNVRGEQIILTIKNDPPRDNSILFKKYDKNSFAELCNIQQTDFYDEIIIYNNRIEPSLFEKLNQTHGKLRDLGSGYIGRGKSKSITAITGKDIRKFGLKNSETPKEGNRIFIQNIYSSESGIIATRGGDLEASETVTVFTDGDQRMISYILGLLHSRLCNYYLYRFCFNQSKLTMHADANYIKKIPLKLADENEFSAMLRIVEALESTSYMSPTWMKHLENLNKLVYRIYSLSSEEIEIVEKEMKLVQSKRWSIDG